MSQNLQIFAKFKKNQFDNLVDFENAAKRVFACKDRCRYSRKRATFAEILPIGRRAADRRNLANFAFELRRRLVVERRVAVAPRALPARLAGRVLRCRLDREIRISLHFFGGLVLGCIKTKFFRKSRSAEILQENMRSTAFFKLYKICILLHRCNLKIFAKKSV